MDRNTLNANVRTEIVMPARAKTVYALWAINPTLSYNVNTPAGSNAPVTPASRTVPYNTAAPDTSGWQTGDTGKIPGYRFDGWYTAPNGGNKYDFNTPLTNNVTVYAQWRINRVTLKFNPNGGTGGYPDITVDAFTTVTIPADAKEPKVQRPGFRFTGWAMKPTPGAGDTILSPGKGTVSMPDRGSITVYAQWAPAMTTLPFTGGRAQVPTLGLYAGLAFMILAMGALMPVIRLRMAAARRGRHAGGTGTAGRHAR